MEKWSELTGGDNVKVKVITMKDTPLQTRCSCGLIRDRQIPDVFVYKMPVSENLVREASPLLQQNL